MRDLIYREILEYHPHMLADYLAGGKQQASFMYPSAVDNFKRQFAHLEAGGAGARMGANANLGQVCTTRAPMCAESAAARRTVLRRAACLPVTCQGFQEACL